MGILLPVESYLCSLFRTERTMRHHMRRCWSCAGTWVEPSPSWRWSKEERRARGNCCTSHWKLWKRGKKVWLHKEAFLLLLFNCMPGLSDWMRCWEAGHLAEWLTTVPSPDYMVRSRDKSVAVWAASVVNLHVWLGCWLLYKSDSEQCLSAWAIIEKSATYFLCGRASLLLLIEAAVK